MWGDQINSFAEFLTINPKVFHNVLSILIYLVFLIFALRHGSTGVVFLVGYSIISLTLEFIGIESYFNLVSLMRMILEAIFGGNFKLSGLWDRIKSIFSYYYILGGFNK